MSILYIPFGYVLKLCGFLSGNIYILSLLFFALIMQIILFPLGIKQQKSQIAMAKVRPKEMAIRAKYAGRTDRPTQQKMQQELQDMYSKNGYNPLSGCLPLLIQLPIIIALFGVIRQPLTYSVALGNSDVDLNAQYFTVVDIYEQAKTGIAGSEYYTGTFSDGTDEKNKQTALKDLYTQCCTAQRTFGATLVSPTEDTKVVSEGDGVWNRQTFEGQTASEMVLAEFITKNIRSSMISTLENYGINNAITVDFDAAFVEKVPNFDFLMGYSFLDTPGFSFNILLIIPILVFASSFFSSVITRKFTVQPQADANGKMPGNSALMKWGLPAMSAYFAFTFPAAIGMYWVFRSLFAVAQQYILAKMFPIPVPSEEEIAAAKREIKNKKKKVVMIEVDEDDHSYDNLAVKDNKTGTSSNGKKVEMLSADEDTPKIEKAPLKDDDEDDKPSDGGTDK